MAWYRFLTVEEMEEKYGRTWVREGPSICSAMISTFGTIAPRSPSNGSVLRIDINSFDYFFSPDWLYPDPVPNVCSLCGEAHPPEDFIWFAGKLYCERCATDNLIQCDECGEYCEQSIAVHDAGGVGAWCPSCARTNSQVCTICGDRWDISVMHANVCPPCALSVIFCQSCDSIIGENNIIYEHHGQTLCESCYDSAAHDENSIHEHDFKPNPVFKKIDGDDDLFLGLELEADSRIKEEDDAIEAAKQVTQAMDGVCYVKHDGSLTSGGFEMVTHPATLHYILENQALFNKLCDIPMAAGFESYDVGTCGLHVHVSRNFFKKIDIAKLLYLNEKLWPEMVKFSRRKGSQIGIWAKRYCQESEMAAITPDEVLAKATGDRYMALNLENLSTIEFRLWRGTLNKETFYATLQFVDNFCRLAIGEKVGELQHIQFVDIINYKNYPELDAYFKKRFPNLEGIHDKKSTVNAVSDNGDLSEERVSVPQFSTPLVDTERPDFAALAAACGLLETVIYIEELCGCSRHRMRHIERLDDANISWICMFEGDHLVIRPLGALEESEVKLVSLGSGSRVLTAPEILYVLGFRSIAEVVAYQETSIYPFASLAQILNSSD